MNHGNEPKKGAVRDHKNYVRDDDLAREYSNYQRQYADTPKECDVKTADFVRKSLQGMASSDRRPRVLDIGCSTGNFLLLLKRTLQNVSLSGGDLMRPVIEKCRADQELAGIEFQLMDIMRLPTEAPYDVITANAVNMYFDLDEYGIVMKSIANALRPGGHFIAYEWVHSDLSERQIIETSTWHPAGLKFWFRSAAFVTRKLEDAGFDKVTVEPFEISIDLPQPAPGSEAARNMVTFTRKTEDGRRLMFRGEGLYQPWAHIWARKRALP